MTHSCFVVLLVILLEYLGDIEFIPNKPDALSTSRSIYFRHLVLHTLGVTVNKSGYWLDIDSVQAVSLSFTVSDSQIV